MKLRKNTNFSFTRNFPKISGYTTTLNCIDGKFPFQQSIQSMLGVCDEVIVVDGGSQDGTRDVLEDMSKQDDRINVYENEFDFEEPGSDGIGKSFGRAIAEHDLLLQMDADEVLHEDQYNTFKMMCKRMPAEHDIIHLPVIELWGSDCWCTARRAPWKWRLSKNKPEITHGIQKEARLVNEETGKVYAKKGMSDGCFYINIMTNEMLPHVGFYTRELEMMRLQDPLNFAKHMNHIYETIPSVWHYSWCDLENKINQLKPGGVWDRMWSLLHQEENPPPRWPDVDFSQENAIKDLAQHLFEQGGEDDDPVKFKFKLTKKQPKIMDDWLEKKGCFK